MGSISGAGAAGFFLPSQPTVPTTAGFSDADDDQNYLYKDLNGNNAPDANELVSLDQLKTAAGADLLLSSEEAAANQISVFNKGTQTSNPWAQSGLNSIDFNVKSKFSGQQLPPMVKTNTGDGFWAWDSQFDPAPPSTAPQNVTRSDGTGGGLVTEDGNDTVVVTGAGTGGGGVVTHGGNDNVTIDGKTGGVGLGRGDDVLILGNNFDSGGISGGSGNDTLILAGGAGNWTVEKQGEGYRVTSNTTGKGSYVEGFENVTFQ